MGAPCGLFGCYRGLTSTGVECFVACKPRSLFILCLTTPWGGGKLWILRFEPAEPNLSGGWIRSAGANRSIVPVLGFAVTLCAQLGAEPSQRFFCAGMILRTCEEFRVRKWAGLDISAETVGFAHDRDVCTKTRSPTPAQGSLGQKVIWETWKKEM